MVCALSAALTVLLGASAARAQTAGPQSADRRGRSALPFAAARSLHFRGIGPAVMGGRVTAVVGIPGDNETYYIGSADGGIFRTEDGGTTWTALFQHQAVASIGALALDPQNPAVIWAGTGEANPRNDVSFGDGIYESTDRGAHWRRMGLEGSYQISGIAINPRDPRVMVVGVLGEPWADNAERGVFRSEDGGRTWTKTLYPGPSTGISNLAMDPNDPQILYAGAYEFRRTPWSFSGGGPEDGLYRSRDGGRTWKRLSGHGLPSGLWSRVGVAFAPSDAEVVYAIIGSQKGVLWRSDDGGEYWSLVNKQRQVDVRPFYFSHVVVDPTNANRVFALSTNLMESDDGGRSFHVIAGETTHPDHHALWIDPSGRRMVDGNDGGVLISSDGGRHWRFPNNLALGQFYHVAVDDARPFYAVCGGLQDNAAWCGAAASQNPMGILNRAWLALNGGDGIFAVPDPLDPEKIYNSTQNAVFMIFNERDGQSTDIEPYPRDFAGGGVSGLPYRFDWDAGFAVSPLDPRVIYVGGNVVFRSGDKGHSYAVISPDLTRNDKSKQGSSGGPVIADNSGAEVYDAILTIAPSPKDAGVIWVGTDDGLAWVTRDGGEHWENVTAGVPDLPPWGRVEAIDASTHNAAEAWMAVDRHCSGDFRPYLFHTTDYGAHWTAVSGNLPAGVYAHVIRQDPRDPELLFAGLENGLYASWDGGGRWYLLGLGLPSAAVYDLQFQRERDSLIVATHGRSLWVLDHLAPLRAYRPGDAAGAEGRGLTLEAAPETFRYWPAATTEALGDGAFAGENPPYGAALEYWVPRAAKAGELVIRNARGEVVRRLRGARPATTAEWRAYRAAEAATPPPAAAARETETAPAARGRARRSPLSPREEIARGSAATATAPLAASATGAEKQRIPWVSGQAGWQRVVWDLRADGPTRWTGAQKGQEGPRAGALVPAGTYTAELKLGGETATAKIHVIEDPRARWTEADMAARYQLEEQLFGEVSVLDEALNHLSRLRGQVAAITAAEQGTAEQAAVDAAARRLEGAAARVEERMTSNPGPGDEGLHAPDQARERLLALEGTLEGSDAPPTTAQARRAAALAAMMPGIVDAYNQFLARDEAAFNQFLAARHLGGVIAGAPLRR